MKCKNIYISRHGVRPTQLPDWAEPCNEPYDGPDYDLPLAAMGRQQAEALAERMKDIQIDHIFSSPFLRAIQSVVPLARSKGIPIKLEWGIEELLKQEWFGIYPELPSAAQRQLEYPEIDGGYQSVIFPEFPEMREDLLERISQTLEILIQNYGPNIFLMAHGASVDGICTTLLDDQPLPRGNFCTLIHLSSVNRFWDTIIGGDVSHLYEKDIFVPGKRSVSQKA